MNEIARPEPWKFKSTQNLTFDLLNLQPVRESKPPVVFFQTILDESSGQVPKWATCLVILVAGPDL